MTRVTLAMVSVLLALAMWCVVNSKDSIVRFDRAHQLKPGMPEAEVQRILGCKAGDYGLFWGGKRGVISVPEGTVARLKVPESSYRRVWQDDENEVVVDFLSDGTAWKICCREAERQAPSLRQLLCAVREASLRSRIGGEMNLKTHESRLIDPQTGASN